MAPKAIVLTLSLLAIFQTTTLCQTRMARVTSTSDSTLSKSELIEFRKEILLKELTFQQGTGERTFLHKWQLRILLVTLIGGYLFLRLKSKSFNDLHWKGWVLAIIVMILSYLYDVHLSTLGARVTERTTCLYKQLYALPTMGYHHLRDLTQIPQTRTHLLADCEPALSEFYSRWNLRIGHLGDFDILLFYGSVSGLFLIGRFGIAVGPSRSRKRG